MSQGTLSLYDHEPSNDQMAPIDQLDLRPTDGTTVAIHSAVAHSEVRPTDSTLVLNRSLRDSNGFYWPLSST